MDPRRLIRNMSILIASGMFLLVLTSGLPMLPVTAHGVRDSHVQATASPPVPIDPTVTALQKAQLAQQLEKLQHDNEWLWNISPALLSTLAVITAALIGIFRWLRERRDEQARILEDREDEREKRSEQRFQSVVKDLSDEDLSTRIGAAIMLRTFLRPGYEQFYAQVFDLTVAHLRLHRRIEPHMNVTEPHLLLTQALITVFKESFPHARDRLHHSPHLLTSIQLGRADLAGADLKQAWIPEAYLVEADLSSAELDGANLARANLTGAMLNTATLTNANLIGAVLHEASLEWAELPHAILDGATLTKANLTKANLTGAVFLEGADLTEANLTGTNLTEAHLVGANLRKANLTDPHLTGADLTGANLSGAHPEAAKSLTGTKMYGVSGLTKEQWDACKHKGARIEESSGGPDQASILQVN